MDGGRRRPGWLLDSICALLLRAGAGARFGRDRWGNSRPRARNASPAGADRVFMSSLFRDSPAGWRTVRLKQTVTACRNGAWGEEPRGGPEDIVCVRVADFDRLRLLVSLDNPTLRCVPEA